MLLTEAMPFVDAMEALSRRTPIGSALSSKEWAAMPLALRDRAFFSAKVAEVGFLSEARRQVGSIVDAKTDRATARTALKSVLGSLGEPVDESDLTNIKSDARLNLIIETNVQQVQGYGNELQGRQPDVYFMYPAKELVDTNPGKTENRRKWKDIWLLNGGRFFDGRMIALKGDPIWTAINYFGNDYAPYAFNSYWVDRDVDRATAIAAGLKVPMSPDEEAPPMAGLNDKLEADLPNATPAVVDGFKSIFGDQVDVSRDGKVVWQGSRIANLYKQALENPDVKWSVRLGEAPAGTVAKAKAAGVDLTGEHLVLDADHIRHADNRHGETEQRKDQQPLTALDFELVPHVWRDPDTVKAGTEPGSLVMTKNLFGDLVMATYEKAKIGVRLATLFKKKGGTP